MFDKIGVVGAGTMGRGVAVDLILHGIDVVLLDLDEAVLERATAEILKTVRMAPMMKPGLARIKADEARRRLRTTTSMAHLDDCGFIVENVAEHWETKAAVYRDLERFCPPQVCFGANTSCLSITRIGSATRRPDKVVGIHFMNPVFLKPVVEVMRGTHTSPETLDQTKAMLAALGKEAIVVGDLPGFVSNRISHLMMNEAMWVVQDGVAEPAQVDAIFKKCFGHAMGPLETADLIGLDVVRDSLAVLYESYQDPKFRCCPLLQRKVDAGQCGRKSGEGFYPYPEE